VGAGEYIDIDNLPPGRYRVGHRESVVRGSSPDREAVGELLVTESLPDDTVRIDVGSPVGVIDKWSEQSWSKPVHVPQIHTIPVPGFDTTRAVVEVPHLEPCKYRFRSEHTNGFLTRIAWVVEGLEPVHP
jgi:hypothetical protein